jgi:hypothetical protein
MVMPCCCCLRRIKELEGEKKYRQDTQRSKLALEVKRMKEGDVCDVTLFRESSINLTG